MNADWFDDDDNGPKLDETQTAAAVLQAACHSLSPEGIPDELLKRLHLLFAGVVQLSGLTSERARLAAKSMPQDAVAEAANRSLNSLTRAAAMVAMSMVEESHACAAPKFSDN